MPEPGLLTIADVATRWGCSVEHAWEIAREGGLPGVWLGTGDYRPTKSGQKLMRFRKAAVEAFEQSREVVAGGPRCADPSGKTTSPTKIPAAAIPGWDGKVRGGATKPKPNRY